ncbi:MAG: 4-(cytidine 5'-diphospho)-2-C-methyl-D-erythritol kinase [Puniceicoccales bacterium]|jgi:4-diphosphocytidyl-2-C-methyl-D-erythritol kinase|nr:4-(cytidine 5'-diphospho)-2-C-methyl-D-erythritol kinase [Puniceicoccales bacterium]
MQRFAFAPAKINLLLAITGIRPDGFHSLTSLVAPIGLGDMLCLSPSREIGAGDVLECDSPSVPTDSSNLVLKAAAIFRKHFPALPDVYFILKKRVPHGAGLGGGSSDAACALRLLNEFTGYPFSNTQLATLAATLGSDCPLFLENKPVVMRGRGEQIEPLPDEAVAALTGRRLLLFKPIFGVSTAEAYAAMKAAGGAEYLAPAEAEARLAAWLAAPRHNPLPLLNNMEGVVFRKHLALPVLLEQLQADFGLAPRMSGSGSACFAFLPADIETAPIEARIHEAWGEAAFVGETTLL